MELLLNPNLAYLLLLVGAFLGFLALVTPGTGGLELGSLICLLLAGFAITQLDFNLWAMILIVLSLIPFLYAIREAKREWSLALAILMLIVGSTYLFRNPNGGLLPAVNPVLSLISSIMFAGFMWIVIRKSMQAFLAPPMHNLGMVVGRVGESKSEIHAEGSVQVDGELWSARSKNLIPPGQNVRVVGQNGFVLDVESEPNSHGN